MMSPGIAGPEKVGNNFPVLTLTDEERELDSGGMIYYRPRVCEN
jgi:hypothetical protein